MLSSIYNSIFVVPILNLIVGLYHLTGGSLGLAIIILTLFVRFILLPLTIPAMRTSKKQLALRPEIEKLKKKYGKDKQKFSQAQMDLFKEHGINPAAGCATQIPMLVILLAVFSVIRRIAGALEVEAGISSINSLLYFNSLHLDSATFNTDFLYLHLPARDPYYVLPILAGIFQFATSFISRAYNEYAIKVAGATPPKEDDMAYMMQKQMMFMAPIMTLFVALSLPSGVALYILVTTIFSLAQTYFLLGGKDRNIIFKVKKGDL